MQNQLDKLQKQKAYDRKVLETMVEIYCRAHHKGGNAPCEQCTELLDYCAKRIAKCPLGDQKTTCQSCTKHCYAPDYRQRIRTIMKYSGPRIMYLHPAMAIRHLIKELF